MLSTSAGYLRHCNGPGSCHSPGCRRGRQPVEHFLGKETSQVQIRAWAPVHHPALSLTKDHAVAGTWWIGRTARIVALAATTEMKIAHAASPQREPPSALSVSFHALRAGRST